MKIEITKDFLGKLRDCLGEEAWQIFLYESVYLRGFELGDDSVLQVLELF